MRLQRLIFIIIFSVLLLILLLPASAQAPNPLPAPDHDIAILVVDDFGLATGGLNTASTSSLDCLLLHTIDPNGSSTLGQATRSIGMATRSLGMTNDETDIDEYHGKYIFTQFVDFSDPSAYNGLDLADYVIEPYLDNNDNFVRYTYPSTHALSGTIATNPNQIEFSGYDLIPVHIEDNISVADIIADAVSRTVDLGYTGIVVNMSFGYFNCPDIDTYIGDPDGAVENVANSDLHQTIMDIKNNENYPIVLFVGAAGNFSKRSPFAPAVWDEVISVSAYDAIDTIANLSERELFMARRDVPQDYYANEGSILMPGTWGDNLQDNATFIGTGFHRVHFEGTSFAAPYLSLFLAQYLHNSGSLCNNLVDVTDGLTLDWSTFVAQTSRNIETIVRSNICPQLHTTDIFDDINKHLNFTTYSDSPSLAISITQPISGTTVTDTFRFEGFAFDHNAGTGNGPGIDWIQIRQGASCGGALLIQIDTGLTTPQAGFDVTYVFSGFGTSLNLPDGTHTLTACGQSSLNPLVPIAQASVTFTVDSGTVSEQCTGITYPEIATTASELVTLIECANQNNTADTINLGADILLTQADNISVTGVNGLPVITSEITINGGGHTIRRDASTNSFRIFAVEASGHLILNDIVIENGSSNSSGGCIHNFDGMISIIESTIRRCVTNRIGGGISNHLGDIVLINTTLTGNQAFDWSGGGLSNTGSATIINSVISGNQVDETGGGIMNFNTMTIANSTVSGNAATSVGGGISNWADANMTITNSVVWGNFATSSGSQLYNLSSMTVSSTAIENGLAGSGGFVQPTDGGNNLTLSGNADIFVNPVRGTIGNTPNVLGDYHLSSYSAVINQGDQSLLPPDTFNLDNNNATTNLPIDIDGHKRVISGQVDMGADEAFTVPPANLNLLYNPSFNLGADGKAGWKNTGAMQSTVISGVVNLRFASSVNGYFRQGRAKYPLPAGLEMEGSIQVANPDNVDKKFKIWIGNAIQTDFYECIFTAPANSPMRTYIIRFPTMRDWEIIRFDMRPQVAGGNGLNFDNASLIYKPSITVTSLECITLPPPNVNLIFNPHFSWGADGKSGWRDEGSVVTNVTDGVMNIALPTDLEGSLRQFRGAFPLEANLRMEAQVDISNPDPITKQINFKFNNASATGGYQCTYTIPPSSPMRTYTMRFPTLQDWKIFRVDLQPLQIDATGLNVDNVSLMYKPTLSTVALECIDPVLPPLPPANFNLIFNPNFDVGMIGEAGWKFYGSIQHNVTNEVMNLSYTTTANGWMRQFRTTYPLRHSLPMEASVDLANPNPTTKTVYFMVRDSGLVETYFCSFKVPPNAPMRTYTMRFKVSLLDWNIIRVDLSPTSVGDNGIHVDNVNLQYKPSLSITTKVCIDPEIPPLPPYNTNLIYNPSFDIGADGLNGWVTGGSMMSSVTNGILKLNFPTVVDGWFHQLQDDYSLRAGLVMNSWVTVSNPDSVSKTMQLMMRDSDLSNTYLCSFSVPPNSNNLVYSLRFITLTDWEVIRADMRVARVDSVGLRFDNVNLRYQPWQTLSANQECYEPAPDEAVTRPPATELVTVQHAAPLQGDDGGSCTTLDWTNTANWTGYLPTSEVQFVFDPFPNRLLVGAQHAAPLHGDLIFDANGDGISDTLYDALSYGDSTGVHPSEIGGNEGGSASATLIREAVIAMLNDRYDSNHPESWWAIEIDTAEALAQGEHAIQNLTQQYALSNASCANL